MAAIEHATTYDAYGARAIERILGAWFSPGTLTEQIAESLRNRIRKVMKHHPVTARRLKNSTVLHTGDGFLWPPASKESADDDPNHE